MISIVIRAKNERQYIAEVLSAALAQDDLEEFEILVIDSGSTDGTQARVREFPVRLEEIAPERFTFGYALNLGTQLSKGRIIVNLSAHCTPTTHDWLRRLIDPLRCDPTLAATYGRQEPRKDVNPFEEPGLQAAFPSDGIQRPVALFSNANCAVWRTVLMGHPFDEALTFSEDLVWRMQFRSEQIRYVPQASVYHSHPIDFRYWARRFESDGVATVAMQRRYGIINPYVQRYPTRAHAAWAFIRECKHWCSFFVFRGYFRFLPLVPCFEAVRVWFLRRGLRKAQAASC